VPIVLKAGSLNLLETSGPAQARNGIASASIIIIIIIINVITTKKVIKPLNAELNPICHCWHYWELTKFSTLAG
jgi:hypothetical protein